MHNDSKKDSDGDLPEELRKALANRPPLPQISQSAEDSWEIEWRQTTLQLGAMFEGAERDAMRTVRSFMQPVSHTHFRDNVHIESGVVHVFLESIEEPENEILKPQALIAFEPTPSYAGAPAMQAVLSCGTYQDTQTVKDDMVTFSQLPSQLVRDGSNPLIFKLSTVQ